MMRSAPGIDVPPARGRSTPGAPTSATGATVLVIDDHSPNVLLLQRLLRAAGFTEVHGVTDSREAVDRCLALQPDVVLLDLHMPFVDGYEVMAGLQAALPSDAFLPILVLTADTSTTARQRALDAGAKDFLTKPFDHVETIQRVRNLLETRALYRALQEHNRELRSELENRTVRERALASEGEERRQRIEEVLRRGQLSMVFQPIVDLARGELMGVEALARFHAEPKRPPNEWFADAAEVGLGTELELAAVAAALHELHRLPDHAFMSVNVSPATAMCDGFTSCLHSVPVTRIVVELTEHSRVEEYELLLTAVEALRAEGARIAVDDAGAGYSGLQHLLRLHPDVIKLDLGLTRGIHTDPARRALARALVSFSAETGAVLLAEGIETADELLALRALGVRWGQGYHLARPGPVSAPAVRRALVST